MFSELVHAGPSLPKFIVVTKSNAATRKAESVAKQSSPEPATKQPESGYDFRTEKSQDFESTWSEWTTNNLAGGAVTASPATTPLEQSEPRRVSPIVKPEYKTSPLAQALSLPMKPDSRLNSLGSPPKFDLLTLSASTRPPAAVVPVASNSGTGGRGGISAFGSSSRNFLIVTDEAKRRCEINAQEEEALVQLMEWHEMLVVSHVDRSRSPTFASNERHEGSDDNRPVAVHVAVGSSLQREKDSGMVHLTPHHSSQSSLAVGKVVAPVAMAEMPASYPPEGFSVSMEEDEFIPAAVKFGWRKEGTLQRLLTSREANNRKVLIASVRAAERQGREFIEQDWLRNLAEIVSVMKTRAKRIRALRLLEGATTRHGLFHQQRDSSAAVTSTSMLPRVPSDKGISYPAKLSGSHRSSPMRADSPRRNHFAAIPPQYGGDASRYLITRDHRSPVRRVDSPDQLSLRNRLQRGKGLSG